MKLITILLTILLISENGMCSIQQAGKCLKDLQNGILHSSYGNEWHGIRNSFIYTIDQVTDISHMGVFFRQLRVLESHIKYSKQKDSWKQWERQYWKVLTDPDINVKHTVTRFITTLKLLEKNLLHKAYNLIWVIGKRNEWLRECGSLVDPLLKVSFYDEMFLNVGAMLQQFGYNSLDEYNMAASQVISVINSAARKLDKVTRDTGIAGTTAGGLSIVSGILTGLGLILAPFTCGGSLALTGAGIALGLGSAVTSITSDAIQVIWDENIVKEVEYSAKSITDETMALLELLQNYASSADGLKIELDFLGDFRAIEYLFKAGIGSYDIYSGTNKLLDVARMTKIVGQIRPGLIAEGLGTKIALGVATPNIKITSFLTRIYSHGMPSILVKGASSALKLSGLSSVVSVGFGIWETISGAKKIKEGSQVAKEFRKLSANLAYAKRTILLSYGIDVEQAYGEYVIGTRYDNNGRPEEWRRACFHGYMCVDLALLSYGVTGNKAEQVCRRNGLYLLAVESQQVSDIVRGFVSKFGRSTWFSNDSSYNQWAPGGPDYNDQCLYFSKSNNFLVKDRNCFRRDKCAVICA